MTERFIRHGNYLTHVYMIEDPVYLTEPLIKTNGFVLTNQVTMQPYPCRPVIEVPRAKGEVPHHLPGPNPFLEEYAEEAQPAVEATRGGAETALPEYMKTRRRPARARWQQSSADQGGCGAWCRAALVVGAPSMLRTGRGRPAVAAPATPAPRR